MFRPPGPEAGGHCHLLDYRVNIFAMNFILSTKSTLVGGQLGGYFDAPKRAGPVLQSGVLTNRGAKLACRVWFFSPPALS